MPRSGSTLLQKLLMSHEDVSSCSEPWFLLNLAGLNDYESVSSAYSSQTLRSAVGDLISLMPNKEQDWYRHIRDFSTSVYSDLSDSNARYFIDKTPRYFLIVDFIKKIYPDAKLIFLFRNPVEIVASYMSSFSHGDIGNFDNYDNDFKLGFSAIANGYKKYKSDSYLVGYDDLVGDGKEEVIRSLFSFLELKNDGEAIVKYQKQKLNGSFGDKNINTLKQIEKNPSKWKGVVDTNAKRRIVIDIIKNVDLSYLGFAGYDKGKLLVELSEHKASVSIEGILLYLKVVIRRKLKALIGWKSYS